MAEDAEQPHEASIGPYDEPTSEDAFYSLLEAGGHFKGAPREALLFRSVELGRALDILAHDDSDLISDAARYHALVILAKKQDEDDEGGLPDHEIADRRAQYAAFASTFSLPGKEAELVEHVHSRQGLDLDPAAFLREELAREVTTSICKAELVSAQGKDGSDHTALSLYCEYDSKAPWETLVGWLDPESWPVRGPLLFKKVTLVKPPGRSDVPGTGVSGWFATYREKVSLVGLPLDTYLDCALHAGVGFATMTYDLNRSVGDRLTVDRGYLSIVRRPGTDQHQIRALKLVAFTDFDEDDLDGIMCPVWADCVRAAAEKDAR